MSAICFLGKAGSLTGVDLALLGVVGEPEQGGERESREEGDCVHANVDVVSLVEVRSLLLGEDVGRDGTGETTEADDDGNADRSLGLTTDGLGERGHYTGESSVRAGSRDELSTVSDLGVLVTVVERETPADGRDEGTKQMKGKRIPVRVGKVGKDDDGDGSDVYTGTVNKLAFDSVVLERVLRMVGRVSAVE